MRFSVAIGTLAAVAALAIPAMAQETKADLKNPAAFTATAPATFKALFETSAGNFTIEVHREWAPKGADRFYNLVKNGFYNDVRFFRVIPGFMVQFGMHGDPAVGGAWMRARMADDPVKQSNKRGYVTFAMGGPNTRTTQVFINFGDNGNLDSQGFAPFGKVIDGMGTVDKLNSAYGAKPGEDQGNIAAGGNAYLMKTYPKLDFIKKATIVGE